MNMHTNAPTLAPCPFCGGAARFLAKSPYWAGFCAECMSRGQLAGTRERAAELWNRRAASIAERAEVERLTAEVVRLDAQLDACMQGLVEIHNYAHDCSTGPTVPDHFWAIREMAARLIKADSA